MSESITPQPQPNFPVNSTAPGQSVSLRSPALLASVPALLLLGVGFWLKPDPVEQPITRALTTRIDEVADAVAVVPMSQTMVVVSKQASGYSLLRGELQPIVRARGEAPLSGQVSRVMVRTGQSVNVGDRVLQLSTGVTSRPPAGVERAQTAAEAAQVAAARQQDALQAKMQKAQAQLREAQLRVDAAQRGVAKAREMVARLQRDGNLTSPSEREAPVVQREAAPSPAVRAAENARREAEAAGREATRAASKAATARRAIDAAEASAKQKHQKQQDAEANLDKVQEQFETKAAKGSDVEAARTAAADAKTEASEAEKKVSAARDEAEKLSTIAKSAEAKAKQLTASAQKQEQSIPVSERVAGANRTEVSRSTQANQKRGSSDQRLTIAQAARIVAAAVAESDSAIKSAESLKRRVDAYEHQAKVTQEKIDSSSTRLEAAQERVMENTIQANLSVVRAPATGTVSWVAPIATEVSAGEKLITITHPNMLEVQFRDYSDAWKQLKPGATLPAIVQSGNAIPAGRVSPSTARLDRENARPQAVARPASLAPGASNTVATTVRLRSVTPPTQPGAPAVLRAVVYNPPQVNRRAGSGDRQMHAGLPIVCSVTKPGSKAALNIPVAAIRADAGGTPTVAVLSPVQSSTPGDTIVPSDEVYRIEWREVKLGKGDGIQRVVESGLLPGDRIALLPSEVHAITLSHGPEATIRLATT